MKCLQYIYTLRFKVGLDIMVNTINRCHHNTTLYATPRVSDTKLHNNVKCTKAYAFYLTLYQKLREKFSSYAIILNCTLGARGSVKPSFMYYIYVCV